MNWNAIQSDKPSPEKAATARMRLTVMVNHSPNTVDNPDPVFRCMWELLKKVWTNVHAPEEVTTTAFPKGARYKGLTPVGLEPTIGQRGNYVRSPIRGYDDIITIHPDVSSWFHEGLKRLSYRPEISDCKDEAKKNCRLQFERKTVSH
jgi:hypothetical protein